jgi:Protein of unknown function (DUF1499)
LRIPIRTSKWAVWASRAARLALPVIVIAAFMHRGRIIDSPTFMAAAGAGVVLGLIALAVGLIAYMRIWITGDRGWRPATIGVATGLICLVPLVMAGLQASRLPLVHDVSTDVADPPAILGTSRYGLAGGFDDPALQAQVAEAFPNASGRDYPLPASVSWPLVAELADLRGWEILARRSPSGARPGTVNAVAMTWLGWRDEVSIRVTGIAGGSRVDVRSVSYEGMHDLGTNGTRIEQFLLDLDDAVTTRSQELGIVASGD